MKKLVFTFAFVCVSTFGFSQDAAKPAIDENFKKECLAVIEASGSGNMLNNYKDQLLTQVPDDKKAAFTVEFDGLMSKINEKTAEVYMQVYTKEDVKGMMAFYNSPVGKKMKEKAGELNQKSQESMMEIQADLQALMMKYMQ
ncbi:DUF2059 domain-containing protein [Flavobacterium sp.]|jgi:hypothetical protein|uniref:DUF2059 domain-containing protein n=1 Tax=Flavobacterium sp. TaxID=239 RepID=UPI00262E8C2E|nr:DUF2059 domain-containing protein [Flavobacterium sp.]